MTVIHNDIDERKCADAIGKGSNKLFTTFTLFKALVTTNKIEIQDSKDK